LLLNSGAAWAYNMWEGTGVTTVRTAAAALSIALAGACQAAVGPDEARPPLSSGRSAYILPIEGTIELGVSSYVARSLAEAEALDVDTLVVVIDTFGGRLDAAVDIKDALSTSRMRTVAYVDNKAISAGALIAVACDHIVMVPGATIGAATPVQIGPVGGEATPTSEKEVSVVREMFRATAENNGHNPDLAEAMVDTYVRLDLVEKGEDRRVVRVDTPAEPRYPEGYSLVRIISDTNKLLTLSTSTAVELGLAAAEVNSIEEAGKLYGFQGAGATRAQVTWSEALVRFLTNPAVTGLLLLGGIAGIYMEFRVPGFGFPGTFGLICLFLFFFGRYLAGLAGATEILIFLLGALLLAIELFVIPGFGITGISGITLMLVGIYLAMVKHPIPSADRPWELERFYEAMIVMAVALLGMLVAVGLGLRYLPQTAAWRRIALETAQSPEAGYVSGRGHLLDLVGSTGLAETKLRPAGTAVFGARRVDVVSRGEFIDKGTPVRVAKVDGPRVLVDPVSEEPDRDSDGGAT